MTSHPVFRPAADRYLPLGLALMSGLAILFATQTWGLGVLREQFPFLELARNFTADRALDLLSAPFPGGPLWPLLLSLFPRTGFEIEFAARIWQALMIALVVYAATRFLLRHVRSRAVVFGAGVAYATGLVLLSDPFTLSPVPTALLLLHLGMLALARFLYSEGVAPYLGTAVCFAIAALLWTPAVSLAIGAILAILFNGRGNLARRTSGVIFFSAAAILPQLFVLLQNPTRPALFDLTASSEALSQLTSWTMFAAWPWWLRFGLTLVVLASLLLVYLSTRGPAGIGPALKRRELQVLVLMSFVWLAHLLCIPASATFAPMLLGLIIWPALGLDSLKDQNSISALWNGHGARVLASASALLLVAPLWQTVTATMHHNDAGSGLRGFDWQSSALVQTLRHSDAQLLYADNASLARYLLGRDVAPLPDDLRTLDLSEGSIVILGDHCPESLCGTDGAEHATLTIEPVLTTSEGMLYNIGFRPPEPALTASDSLTIP
ncbi:MAG: hypothetical protein H6508_00765 [Calditrichaeota bacterium]|nr:hypothetical protein [Calditrichota bacterium]